MPAARPASRDQVIAYRWAAQGLDRLAGPSRLVPVAGMGLHDPVPGTAAQAVRARVAGLAPDAVDRALHGEKSLVRLWSLRMAPYVVPTADLALFTAAIRPPDTAARQAFLMGATAQLAEAGVGVDELVDRTAAALRVVLDGRALPKHQLVHEIAEALADGLTGPRRAVWHQDARYVEANSVGEMLVSFALRVVALEGAFCSVRRGHEQVFVRTDQWLGRALPGPDPEAARVALLRRYLRHYGPSTAAHFAAWASLGKPQAQAAWDALAPALVPLALGRRTAWLHADDLAAFDAAPPPAGVRLLPPYDPWLAPRDRETTVPAKERHRALWRAVGNPGVVVAAGEVVATWKAKRVGQRLQFQVVPFKDPAAALGEVLGAEAEAIASIRGTTATTPPVRLGIAMQP